MAGLLAFPQFTSLMSGMTPAAMTKPRPIMADAEDERMFAANPNGDQLNQLLGALLLGQKEAPAMAQAAAPQGPMPSPSVQPAPGGAIATPQRQRVSGWRVLDRVLGGSGAFDALDAERARLQAEAERPQMMARAQENEAIARALGPQALLALRTNAEKLGEGLAAQYSPQVIGAGGIQSVVGQGTRVGAPSVREFGDRIATTDPLTAATTYSAPRAPTFQENTARLAASTANVAQDGRLVDTATGRVIAEGIQRPDIQNVAPGGEALAFDAQGNIVNRVGSTQARPQSQSEIKRADELELALTSDENSIAKVRNTLSQIVDPDGPEGPLRPAINVSGLANLVGGIRNTVGASNANSLGIADIKTTVEALRQGILNDATGPQTEGDALRALNSVLAGINDPDVIAQGLNDYLRAKERTAGVRRQQLERMRGGNAPAAGGPQVGMVEDGYRYLGGPPGEPSSWEPVQ